mmetsp:Transcript_107564/g.273008  ORF Transcript_107564/g.273008 Transcript_107564/m.273008 type:complete len:269 (-) Transcript_107564:66-872(-)
MEGKSGESPLQQDHEDRDQMQLGIRIITSAFQNKMHSLEQEIRGLRLGSEEQRSSVNGLQKRNSGLEVELVESHQRSQQLQEENKELFRTVTNLRKQIERLEHLKRAVMSSIQDDQAQEAELGDTRMLMSDEFLRGATPLTAADMGNYGFGAPAVSSSQQQRSFGGGGPVGALGLGPAVVPMEPIGLPQVGNSIDAPVGGAIDGKQFFRQARSRLSYEAFNLFLASIKRLNNQQQTREETLDEARRIFGPELQDLYKDFESLLNRHGM